MILILLGVFMSACAGIQSRFHWVSNGETVDQIARKYDVPVQSLRVRNQALVRGKLRVGTKLYVPFEENPKWNNEDPERYSRDPKMTAAVDHWGDKFLWPVAGTVSSHYGKRSRNFHRGIDIVARKGTPVYASRSGTVIYSGSQIRGYGNLVIIKHADQYATVYAHLLRRDVRRGQFISKGRRLGLVGNTGRSTSPHLHFEIRESSRPVNPLFFLQGQVAANIVNR